MSRKEKILALLQEVWNRTLSPSSAIVKLDAIVMEQQGRIAESPIFMYHKDHPKGKMFAHPDDVPQGEGWVDSPAKIGTPAVDEAPKEEAGKEDKPAEVQPEKRRPGRPAKG